MFGIGSTELLVILVVALIVIGPSKLPEMARTLGKAMGEFRRMSSDVKRTIEMEADKEQSKPAPAPRAASGTGADTATAESGAGKSAAVEPEVDSVSGDRGETVVASGAEQSGKADSKDGEKA